jgi:CheY-like chemotaxis protein
MIEHTRYRLEEALKAQKAMCALAELVVPHAGMLPAEELMLELRPAEGKPIIILLADDDEDDQILIADALRAAGLPANLKTVGDGEELMDYLYHRGAHAPASCSPRPNLILLDLNMPRKDGREALREMKADPALRGIPVVILSTSKTQADIECVYAMGGNSFIVKPVTFDGLAQAMKVATEYWFQVVQLPTAAMEN